MYVTSSTVNALSVLGTTYQAVLANYWQIQSIARPLYDCRATCYPSATIGLFGDEQLTYVSVARIDNRVESWESQSLMSFLASTWRHQHAARDLLITWQSYSSCRCHACHQQKKMTHAHLSSFLTAAILEGDVSVRTSVRLSFCHKLVMRQN